MCSVEASEWVSTFRFVCSLCLFYFLGVFFFVSSSSTSSNLSFLHFICFVFDFYSFFVFGILFLQLPSLLWVFIFLALSYTLCFSLLLSSVLWVVSSRCGRCRPLGLNALLGALRFWLLFFSFDGTTPLTPHCRSFRSPPGSSYPYASYANLLAHCTRFLSYTHHHSLALNFSILNANILYVNWASNDITDGYVTFKIRPFPFRATLRWIISLYIIHTYIKHICYIMMCIVLWFIHGIH